MSITIDYKRVRANEVVQSLQQRNAILPEAFKRLEAVGNDTLYKYLEGFGYTYEDQQWRPFLSWSAYG